MELTKSTTSDDAAAGDAPATDRPDALPEYVISPGSGWLEIDLGELLHYRGLIWLLVRRDFVAIYKQTILGPAWFVLKPLLTTLTFVVVFGKIAQLSTDGLPQFLFYFSGTFMWQYFSDTFLKTSNFFVASAKILRKVYFPRLIIPLSILISNVLVWLLQFAMFIGFLSFFRLRGVDVGTNRIAWLTPVLLLLLAAFGMGLGTLASALTVKYRDLSFLLTFGIQLMMYATPVIYPLSTVPQEYRWLLLLNPLTPVLEAFRYGFLGQGSFTSIQLGVSALAIAVTLLIGLAAFSRAERTFVDLV